VHICDVNIESLSILEQYVAPLARYKIKTVVTRKRVVKKERMSGKGLWY